MGCLKNMLGEGHVTPHELDYLFDREIISTKDYEDFWESYWGGLEIKKRDMVKSPIPEEIKERPSIIKAFRSALASVAKRFKRLFGR